MAAVLGSLRQKATKGFAHSWETRVQVNENRMVLAAARLMTDFMRHHFLSV